MGNAGQTRLFINNVSWASIWSKWAMPARHYPAPHYEADNAEIKAKWNSKCPINLTRAVRADILEYCHLVAMVNGHVCANFMSGFNLRPFVRHIPENKWQWGNETVLFSLLMNISYKQNMFQFCHPPTPPLPPMACNHPRSTKVAWIWLKIMKD